MKSKPKPKTGGKAPQMAFRGYWDATEEQALRDAVQKHGIGAWEKMRHDVDFKVLKCVPNVASTRAAHDAHPRRARVSLFSIAADCTATARARKTGELETRELKKLLKNTDEPREEFLDRLSGGRRL
jgi:hypothetical protein